MDQDKSNQGQSGGVNIDGGHVSVGGDIVGRDKITANSSGLGLADWKELTAQFAQIRQKIDARPEDPNVDKSELADTVNKIQEEVKKGPEANSTKVERWLRFLAGMSDDIFEVTVATLANPVVGAAKAIQLIAKKAQAENQAK